MADIELHRVHGLGLKAARAAADRMAEHLGRKFDLKGDWEGNVLRFERPGVTGSLVIGEQDLRLSVALGFLLKAMKGSIEKAVEHELDALFAPAPPRRPPATKPPGARPGKPAASRKKAR
ncbi:MAG TPA: polyhydroxyalkanoic acid system family protein [Usitatibacter sp.]|nr:polyhydroxyalkanoic acid system family protein [Usitatibacter sp.]